MGRKIKKFFGLFLSYFLIIAFIFLLSSLGVKLVSFNRVVIHNVDFQLFVLGGVLFVSYVINQLAPRTAIPSFVWVIIAGIFFQPLLKFFSEDIEGLKIMVELSAALILFTSGLEIPFGRFKRWFFSIASLSLIGVILSSVLFAVAITFIMKMMGLYQDQFLVSIVLLSAALSSTDPTAILPTLRDLHLKRSFIKQIAISESALTDVSGSILTRFLLLAFVSTASLTKKDGLVEHFLPLLQKSTYDAFALQVLSGIIVGYFGYFLIKSFYQRRTKEKTGEIDASLLIAVPIFTYVLGNILGGAGFLASFTAGLFSDLSGDIKKASHFYDQFLNNLIKPFIFIILGSLVHLSILFSNAIIGLVGALLFMFLIRPVVVFISLFPWYIKGLFKIQDLFFLSFVRETGIIAAVLLIIISASNLVDSNFVISLGMWIIILTLIIEPPLTPWLCQKIGLTKEEK